MASLRHFAAAATVGLLLLAGCTAPTSAPTTAPPTTTAPVTESPSTDAKTSVAEDCAVLGVSMQEAVATLQSAMTELASDPDKALTALEDFHGSFAESIGGVSSPELKAQANKALDAMKLMVDTLKAGLKNPTKLVGIDAVIADFEEQMTAIGTVCEE